jgi:hypothetical protein
MAFFEGPNGELDWTFVGWDEKFQKYSNNELRSMDACLSEMQQFLFAMQGLQF